MQAAGELACRSRRAMPATKEEVEAMRKEAGELEAKLEKMMQEKVRGSMCGCCGCDGRADEVCCSPKARDD